MTDSPGPSRPPVAPQRVGETRTGSPVDLRDVRGTEGARVGRHVDVAPGGGSTAAAPAGEVAPSVDGPPRRRRWGRVVSVVLLALGFLLAVAAAVHLLLVAQAWEERAEEYRQVSAELGAEVATTRAQLAGVESELDTVRTQLATAHTRIVELADEKARLGDDREVQRQLVDYQQRVSAAAGQVALALESCVEGQQRLIGYLEASVAGTAVYDPGALSRFGTDVDALCRTATEANEALQQELAR